MNADAQTPVRAPGRAMMWVHGLGLLAAAVVAAATAGSVRWHLSSFVIIAGLTIASDLTSVETDAVKVKISGSFLGLILAAVVLGGAAAALIGVLTISVGWLRSREAGHYFRNNIVTYAWFPLAGGLYFSAAQRVAHVGPHTIAYYLIVFATFMVALALNFSMIAGYQAHIDGTSLARKAREALRPVLASELFSALLTLAAVYVAVEHGPIGLALFALILVVFQYLATELLASKRRADALHRMATTDELTGLSNRESFGMRVRSEIERCTATGETFAVMLIDLDRFKEVNDTLGHHVGDLLLEGLGPRLRRCVGNDSFIARLGGDEFAILPAMQDIDPDSLGELAGELLACLQDPFEIDELALEIGGSVGIARFPVDGTDPATLLRRADIAMYAAKDEQTGHRLYTAEQDQHSVRRLNVLSDFRRALMSDELIVHYQPIVSLSDLEVRGAEALVRWEHPTHGLIPPGGFLDVVEQTPMIGRLTRHVLEQSIGQCASWRREGRDLSVAVNLSVRSLLDRQLPGDIERLLTTYSLPSCALHLEITESMIMSDPERALATVSRLSALGVRLSVDDFGTGYSSLANLRRLPINDLKIDRSFVTPMLDDNSDLIIVNSTIKLGHDLGLEIIAEGVEDRRTLEHLGLLGCDLAQGYHLSRPLPSDDFAAWLAPNAAAAR